MSIRTTLNGPGRRQEAAVLPLPVICHPPQTSALPLSQEGFIIWTGISKRPLRGLLSSNLISTYRRTKAGENRGWGRKCAF